MLCSYTNKHVFVGNDGFTTVAPPAGVLRNGMQAGSHVHTRMYHLLPPCCTLQTRQRTHVPLKKNPLKNLGALLKLNPYAKTARRQQQALEVRRLLLCMKATVPCTT